MENDNIVFALVFARKMARIAPPFDEDVAKNVLRETEMALAAYDEFSTGKRKNKHWWQRDNPELVREQAGAVIACVLENLIAAYSPYVDQDLRIWRTVDMLQEAYRNGGFGEVTG